MGAPAVIAIPRVTEIGVGDSLKAAGCMEPRGQLIGESLVLDEAVLARQSNSLFIEAFCVETPIFDAGYLRRDQSIAILEILGAGLRPDFKPLLMGLQIRQKLGSLVERRLIVVASRGQRAIEMVFGFVSHADNRPQHWFCSSSCCDGCLVISGHDTGLELEGVITAPDYHISIAVHELLIFIFLELGAAKRRKFYSKPLHGQDEAPCSNDDLTGGVKSGLASKVQQLL